MVKVEENNHSEKAAASLKTLILNHTHNSDVYFVQHIGSERYVEISLEITLLMYVKSSESWDDQKWSCRR